MKTFSKRIVTENNTSNDRKLKPINQHTDHQKNNKDKRFECAECPSFFKLLSHLKTHVKNVHFSDTRTYKCKDCDKKFDSKLTIYLHRKTEHTYQHKVYKCKFCEKLYNTKTALNLHVRADHTMDFKRSPCPYCSSNFKWHHHLKIHIRKKHMEVGHTPSDLIKKGLSGIRRKINDCFACAMNFTKKLDLLLHLRNVHQQELDIYKCCICHSAFALADGLKLHFEEHKMEMSDHKCGQCHPVLSPIPYFEDNGPNLEPVHVPNEVTEIEIALKENDETNNLTDGNNSLPIDNPDMNTVINKMHTKTKNRRLHKRNKTVPSKRDRVAKRKRIGHIKRDRIAKAKNFEPIRWTKCDQCKVSFQLHSAYLNHLKNHDEYLGKTKDSEASNLNGDITTNIGISASTDVISEPLPLVENKDLNNKVASNNKINKELQIILPRLSIVKQLIGLGTTVQKINCPYCNFKFKFNASLNRHLKLKHSNEDLAVPRANLDGLQNKKHKSKHNKVESSLQPVKKTTRNDLGKKSNTDKHKVKQKSYECGHCVLFFASKLELLQHISEKHMTSLKVNRISCDFCHFTCTDKTNLISHVTEMHPDCNLYKCTACNMYFKDQNSFDVHVKALHRHICGVCNLTFVNKEKVLSHMKESHNAMQYECDICQSKFRLEISLVNHREKEHNASNEVFPCSECSLSFETVALLRKHKICHRKAKVHKVHITDALKSAMEICNLCNALLQDKIALHRHTLIEHNKDTLHKCGQCASIFNDIEEMREHILIEHGNLFTP